MVAIMFQQFADKVHRERAVRAHLVVAFRNQTGNVITLAVSGLAIIQDAVVPHFLSVLGFDNQPASIG